MILILPPVMGDISVSPVFGPMSRAQITGARHLFNKSVDSHGKHGRIIKKGWGILQGR
jgi:hypothetical protein